ncbi:ROK family protein [Alicyclobacillus fastidiosus]|uniref:ROK family protein n=1 Tax=Alicyclobacillus fastidiosus TaxID=392011 RepID=A0ABY6ZM98_9BACL|nr:ROK family protein [Alicyclobacillus fastidiosus]WAH43974.1 ROK family protein [Alicyclobacillus fastidiosus]GMA60241.1 glucokinase [Alicyclobacillus fastidiosus]
MEEVYVGVDIGGTNTVIGLFNRDLNLIAKTVIATTKPHFPPKTNNPREFFDELTNTIESILMQFATDLRLAGVGMGVPGKVNAQQGTALEATNLGWYDVPISSEMSQRLGTYVQVDNDVRTYTLGESKVGAAKGYQDVICVTLGTGLAAGIMVDGKLVKGSDWCAGEIGHDFVPGQTFRCNCGRQGCLETIASATGIVRLAEEAVKGGVDTCLKLLNRPITAVDVCEAAIHGDNVSLSLFQFIGTELGSKLTTAVFLLNPEVIIIGGGVSAAGDILLRPLRERIYSIYGNSGHPKIVASTLGDSAGVYGAAHLAMNSGEL